MQEKISSLEFLKEEASISTYGEKLLRRHFLKELAFEIILRGWKEKLIENLKWSNGRGEAQFHAKRTK